MYCVNVLVWSASCFVWFDLYWSHEWTNKYPASTWPFTSGKREMGWVRKGSVFQCIQQLSYNDTPLSDKWLQLYLIKIMCVNGRGMPQRLCIRLKPHRWERKGVSHKIQKVLHFLNACHFQMTALQSVPSKTECAEGKSDKTKTCPNNNRQHYHKNIKFPFFRSLLCAQSCFDKHLYMVAVYMLVPCKKTG